MTFKFICIHFKICILFFIVIISCSFFSSNDSYFFSTGNYKYINRNTNQLISILDKTQTSMGGRLLKKRRKWTWNARRLVWLYHSPSLNIS